MVSGELPSGDQLGAPVARFAAVQGLGALVVRHDSHFFNLVSYIL
jgi:hypothetical protein